MRTLLEQGQSGNLPQFQPIQIPSFLDQEALQNLLLAAHELGVSDLSIMPDQAIQAKLHNIGFAITSRAIGDTECRLILEVLYGGAHGIVKLGAGEPLDFDYELKVGRRELLRFRCNVVSCRIYGGSGFEITIRVIHGEPPSIEQLGVDEVLRENLMPPGGLVLICGATSQGKSTLLASTIRYRLEHGRNQKIVCYEAPIEYVYDRVKIHSSNRITQTEIPRHLRGGFAEGARSSLRRAPNIVLIGEIRDAETISSALILSQTGHLVYATAHASSPGIALRRLVNAFDSSERASRLIDIISAVRLILVQELVPAIPEGRTAIREWIAVDEVTRERLFIKAAENLEAVSIELQKMVAEKGTRFVDSIEEAFFAKRISKHTAETRKQIYHQEPNDGE